VRALPTVQPPWFSSVEYHTLVELSLGLPLSRYQTRRSDSGSGAGM